MYKRHSINICHRSNRRYGFKRARCRIRSIKTRKHRSTGSARPAGNNRWSRWNRLCINNTRNNRIKCRNPVKSVSRRLFPKWPIWHFRSIKQRNNPNSRQCIRPWRNRPKIQKYIRTQALRRRPNHNRYRPDNKKKHGNVIRRVDRRGALHIHRRIQRHAYDKISANIARKSKPNRFQIFAIFISTFSESVYSRNHSSQRFIGNRFRKCATNNCFNWGSL